MHIWHQLIDFLATHLNDTIDVRRRRLLVEAVGLGHLAPDLEWEGSPRTFVQGLLAALHRLGQGATTAFVAAVLTAQPWGVEDTTALNNFRDALAALPAAQWRTFSTRLPRIYVAHHTTGSADHPLLAPLTAALRDGGFEVVEQDAALIAADDWRARLLLGIGNCHGGVVLLDEATVTAAAQGGATEHALLQDATLLRWRAWRDADFVLVPLCVDSAAANSLGSGPWARLEMTALPPIDGGNEGDPVAAVLARLAVLHERSPKRTWIVALEENLAGKLSVAADDQLRDALEWLVASGNGLKGDDARYTLGRRLARAVLHHGLPGLDTVIERAAGGNLTPATLRAMLEMLAFSWVDMRAAAQIPRYTLRPFAERVFGVNGTLSDFTGQHYVSQACQDFRGPEYTWRIIQVTHDDVTSVIDAEIRPNLIAYIPSLSHNIYPMLQSRYAGDPARLNREIDAWINRKLAEFEQNNKPIFVVFGPGQFDVAKLDAIRQVYPRLTFFLLTGSLTAEPPFPGIEMLLPPLPPDAEVDAQMAYFAVYDKIPQ